MSHKKSGKPPIECKIRPAKDLEEIRKLWWPLMQELDWNRNIEDAATHLYCSGIDAWFVAIPSKSPTGEDYPGYSEDSKDGTYAEPQGSLTPMVNANSTAWVTFFILNKPYRGHKIGKSLFENMMKYFFAKKLDFIGLDAVKEQVGFYKSQGFEETNETTCWIRPNVRDIVVKGKLAEGESLVDLKGVSVDNIRASDLAIFGMDRSRLWTYEAMFNRPDATGYAVLSGEGTLKGWVLIRECEHGYRIGPLYAEGKDAASFLLYSAMNSLQNKDASLIVELFGSNKNAAPVFEEAGWETLIPYSRMWYKGKVPPACRPGGRAEREMFAIFDSCQG